MAISKIFGIGFHKTGTTTLESDGRVLGYRTAPVRTDLAKSLAQGDLGPTLQVAGAYDLFQDNPWPVLYEELYQQFPDARFVFTWRDEADWIKSIVNSFSGKSTAMREWIYGEGNGDPEKNPNVFLERYRMHREGVEAFFADKPGKLLNVNWSQGHGWPEL